jgi:pimeloyl-ACP methyl ester carboxylesterase
LFADELGTVVFLHGFPEIWYTWRHQMLAVAAAGYRAIAPDSRGYGLSDQPPEDEVATWENLVADVLGILDALSIPKVTTQHNTTQHNTASIRFSEGQTRIQSECMHSPFHDMTTSCHLRTYVQAFMVGKDFGAMPAYDFALRHPDRTRGVMCLGIPFSPVPITIDTMPEGYYILRWREPGRAEADFGRHDVRRVVRTIYILFSRSEVPVADEEQEIMDLADLSTPLPPWFTEEDLDAYAALYEKSGFRYPLQIPYR